MKTPTLLTEDIDNGFCKVRATKDQLRKHYEENRRRMGKVKTYNVGYDEFHLLNDFDDLADRESYKAIIHLSSLGNVIHILV